MTTTQTAHTLTTSELFALAGMKHPTTPKISDEAKARLAALRAKAIAHPLVNETLYVSTSGCTTILDGEHGTTTGFHYTHNRTDGAFIVLDNGQMIYAELAMTSDESPSHREVLNTRHIDRAEFDRLTGIENLRTEMGWRA